MGDINGAQQCYVRAINLNPAFAGKCKIEIKFNNQF